MSRIGSAFKSFFAILFQGVLPADVAREFGYVQQSAVKASPAAAPADAPVVVLKPSDGALQILGILQRDAGWWTS